jgi:hypothetical protein
VRVPDGDGQPRQEMFFVALSDEKHLWVPARFESIRYLNGCFAAGRDFAAPLSIQWRSAHRDPGTGVIQGGRSLRRFSGIVFAACATALWAFSLVAVAEGGNSCPPPGPRGIAPSSSRSAGATRGGRHNDEITVRLQIARGELHLLRCPRD